ncbi:MAG TPA: PAS domain S-box protein [Acidimicrobiales bacterium]|nr:PAS domain S-box protein [Acidimicrobiales bacterium]
MSVLDDSLLAHSRSTREAVSRSRSELRRLTDESQGLWTAARRQRAEAVELRRRGFYARVVGRRNGSPVCVLVRRDGAVSGEQVSEGDPLHAVLTVARGCDHVESVSFRRVGDRPSVPAVRAVARFVDDDRTDPGGCSVSDFGQHAAAPTDPMAFDRVIAELSTALSAAAESAASPGHRAVDPLAHERVVQFAAAVDQAVADLRNLTGDPASGDPASGDPASGDPASGDPASDDPASGDPASDDPASGDPASRPGPIGRTVKALVEASREGMLLVDEDGRMVLVNHHIETLFGYEREELLGQPVEMLMPRVRRDTRWGRGPRHSAGSPPERSRTGVALSGLHHDGSDVPLDVTVSTLGAGQQTATIAVVRALTDRLDREGGVRQKEQDVALGEERQRIARDLNERIIKRLFAIGIGVHSMRGRTADPALRGWLQEVTTDLDATIDDLRTSIFELTGPRTRGDPVLDVPADEHPTHRFASSLRVVGPVETMDVEGVLALLREAVANTSRQAQQSEVVITVSVGEVPPR